MNVRALLVGLALCAFATPAWAVLTQARVSPARSQVSVVQGGQTFLINWVVSTDPTHTLGAVSAQGSFVNAATGAAIAPPSNTTVGTAAGTGPLNYPESVTLTAALVESWRAQGIRLVGYRRTFAAPGGPAVSAQWLLQIRGAGLDGARETTSGELVIQRLDLGFAGGERVAVTERGQPLTANVAIAYAGSGTLRGRWEVADPGSQAPEFYRVLALVREPLAGGVPVTLQSPPLPTQTTGRHALRFCVEIDAAEPCANSSTAVQTFYEVLPAADVTPLRGLSPRDQPLRAGGSFRWLGVAGATTYQLQVFLPPQPPADEPRFVTGILLPGTDVQAVPSALVQSRLQSGQAYLWRLTAHDAAGRLIASSELLPFVYRP